MSTITIATQINIETNGRMFSAQPKSLARTVADALFVSGVILATDTDVAIPRGQSASPKLGMFTNLDAENSVTLGTNTGTFAAVMVIPAGATVIVSLDGILATPFIKAVTEDCFLSYTITD